MTKKLAVVLVAGLLGLMGQRSVNASLADGLVAYWPLDEGSGTSAFDAAGGNDGTLNGGAVYAGGVGIAPVPGNVDALTFDGVDDAITVSHADALDMTAAYTIATWVNIGNINDYQPLFSRGDATGNDIEVYWHPASYQGLTVVHNRVSGGSYDDAVYFASPSVGTLFHLAVVFDGTTVTAYYDGLPAALSGGGCCGFNAELPPPPDNNKGWRIGEVFLVTNGVFQGLLDEVYLYDRALSQSEIVTLAGLPSPSTCETDLAQCEADLTECLTNPVFPDQDGDGEPDATDECPNSVGDAAVDQVGCSLEQFCTAIDATTSRGAKVCENSDWHNDEPLMSGKEADCQVQKNGPSRGDDLCIARQ